MGAVDGAAVRFKVFDDLPRVVVFALGHAQAGSLAARHIDFGDIRFKLDGVVTNIAAALTAAAPAAESVSRTFIGPCAAPANSTPVTETSTGRSLGWIS